MLLDAVRWMDASLVHPVAARLAASVANPAVLSFLLWDRLKALTPQRARDLTRLLTTAMADALGVFGAEKGQQLRARATQLQQDFVRAAVSRKGRDVVLHSVATVAKVAQALNTPETKSATQQMVSTLQSVLDFFASDDGRRVIETTGECITCATEMAASPEASIFLAELASNLLHALESEEIRQQQATADKVDGMVHKRNAQDDRDVENEHEPQRGMEANEQMAGKCVDSPTSSMTDTQSGTHRPSLKSSPAEQNSSYRSARIEKEVLTTMGVDPSMLGEIQRVLDMIAAKEGKEKRAAMQRQHEEAEYVAGLVVPEPSQHDAGGDSADAGIAHAFGDGENEAKVDEDVNGSEGASPPVLVPDWHEEPLRKALHRRHAHAEKVAGQRDPFDRQAREMAAVLVQRNATRGNLPSGDIIACRVIARVLVYGVGAFVLLSGYLLGRHLLGREA
ncbi:unnamed protein product [Hyaloperonospora brassicae]|uniref:Uncharacterized protein n=1 Tax=Hyaloperonospora brassicae TaxID=162125 RepID=A0AAV0THP6_HYABA|nr:unnamed protein product [Hyaloperonospora brassicae]